MTEDAAAHMTAPTTNGDKPLPRKVRVPRSGAEWACLREHEAEIIEYLKGWGPRAA